MQGMRRDHKNDRERHKYNKWKGILPQLWQNRVGRFVRRDGTQINTTPKEETTTKMAGKVPQTSKTDTGEGYITTIGVCPQSLPHWTRGYHRVDEEETCTRCMEERFG